MKILEIFENKLRYKNYSQNTIKTYKQTLYQYFKETNCKDPYRISTKEIVNYLDTKYFTSISQQNQFIGCLKLFARLILNKKDIHLDKIERPRSEKKLPKIIEKEFLLDKLSKIENLKHKSILTLAYSPNLVFTRVLNTLRENKVMVSTREDGIYIRLAGDEDKGESFSKTFVRVKKILKKCKKLKKYVNNRFNRNKELFPGFQ